MTVAGYLAVDSGGSGLRVAVGVPGRAPSAQRETREPVRTGARGIDPVHLMSQLTPLARELAAEAGVEELGTAVVGAAGFATLGDALRAELPDALARALGYDGSRSPQTPSPRMPGPSVPGRARCSRRAPV